MSALPQSRHAFAVVTPPSVYVRRVDGDLLDQRGISTGAFELLTRCDTGQCGGGFSGASLRSCRPAPFRSDGSKSSSARMTGKLPAVGAAGSPDRPSARATTARFWSAHMSATAALSAGCGSVGLDGPINSPLWGCEATRLPMAMFLRVVSATSAGVPRRAQTRFKCQGVLSRPSIMSASKPIVAVPRMLRPLSDSRSRFFPGCVYTNVEK